MKPSHWILTSLAALNLLASPAIMAWEAEKDEGDAHYDRLDGSGRSGKKTQVIEWEGNLEIHVFPAGSLAGLALKLDKRNKDKPVMVIGYRFKDNPKVQLIRRNLLTIDLRENFNAYQDPTESDYDKIVISHNGLAAPLAKLKLDPEPGSLYPEGYKDPKAQKEVAGTGKDSVPPAPEAREPAAASDEDGGIRPFFIEKPLRNLGM